MVQADRRENPALSERLWSRTCDFEFFQAVRLLEWMAWEARWQGQSVAAPVGEDARPDEELVRFRVPVNTSFPAAAMGSLTARAPAGSSKQLPPELSINFLGLIGPSGVLPHHYLAEAVARNHHQDRALADFFDVFQHRAAALFYRAWRKYRLPFELERTLRDAQLASADLAPDDDSFSFALRCLVGLGTSGLADRLAAADETVVFYAGHFSHTARSAVALERMLADFFGLPATVEQFSGRWLTIPPDQRTNTPTVQRPLGQNCSLGRETVLGSRVWDVQTKFRVKLGPMSYRRFAQFFPGESAMQRMVDLVRLYVGPALDFDVQPVLRRDEVPTAQLASPGGLASKLGRNAWLAARPRSQDASEAVFRT
jgi:type VI secretion system protein ImpH